MLEGGRTTSYQFFKETYSAIVNQVESNITASVVLSTSESAGNRNIT